MNSQSFVCSLLMASSLLNNHKLWTADTQPSPRIKLSNMVLDWCFRLVQDLSNEIGVGEDHMRVMLAVVVALATCSNISAESAAEQV
jgi:hypothetical protein